MLSPAISISIDSTNLASDNVSNFMLYSDIFGTLPRGSFELYDTGVVFSKLSVRIGSSLLITLLDQGASGSSTGSDISKTSLGFIKENQMMFCPMVVTDVVTTILNPATLESKHLISFAHPWVLYSDMKNHAYAAQPVSDIIKLVIKESERAFKIDYTEENFDTTNDDGKQMRYKCGESDYDFIMKKLLPFAQVNNGPAYFFIDSIGAVFFKAFTSMFTQGTAASIVFSGTSTAENTIVIDTVNPGELTIGKDSDNKSIINRLKIKSWIEDLLSRKFLVGNRLPITKSGSGKEGAIFPVNYLTMGSIESSDNLILMNRSVEDQFALVGAYQRPLDQMFTFYVNTSFCGDKLQVGNSVEIEMGNVQTENPHWVKGKWVVSSITHNRTDIDSQLTSRIGLIRPSLSASDKSTITDSDLLYQII